MKITVRVKDCEIIVDESDNGFIEKKATIRYSDQMEYVHKTIIEMVDGCLKLVAK